MFTHSSRPVPVLQASGSLSNSFNTTQNIFIVKIWNLLAIFILIQLGYSKHLAIKCDYNINMGQI